LFILLANGNSFNWTGDYSDGHAFSGHGRKMEPPLLYPRAIQDRM
jgi:hypothetical protein